MAYTGVWRRLQINFRLFCFGTFSSLNVGDPLGPIFRVKNYFWHLKQFIQESLRLSNINFKEKVIRYLEINKISFFHVMITFRREETTSLMILNILSWYLHLHSYKYLILHEIYWFLGCHRQPLVVPWMAESSVVRRRRPACHPIDLTLQGLSLSISDFVAGKRRSHRLEWPHITSVCQQHSLFTQHIGPCCFPSLFTFLGPSSHFVDFVTDK